MSASLLHFVLIHHGAASRPDHPRVLHFNAGSEAGLGAPSGSPVDLLVLDARRMNPPCVQAAYGEAGRLRTTTGFRHGVLVCDLPQLPLVLGAIRAGLRDIIHEPLSARQLVRMLRSATTGHQTCARQISALAAIVRTIATADAPAESSPKLARREYALLQRAEQLDHRETRLNLERAALEDREQKLRVGTRRLERELATLQKDPDLPRPAPAHTPTPFTATPFTATPFATDLQAIATQLSERAQALDIRERMLHELESLLTSA